MDSDRKILGYQLLTNSDVELHSQEELQGLVKAKAVTKDQLQYSRKLAQYLSTLPKFDRKTEEGQAKYKKLTKELSKMSQLNELDRVMILNNQFHNQAELRLKVGGTENLSSKERKTILELLQ